MSSDRADPLEAAEHLIEVIQPPSDCAVSISTLFRPGRTLAIKVFIQPQYRYLESRVPLTIDGFDVLHEVASLPSTNW
jgi:hypothetical protein